MSEEDDDTRSPESWGYVWLGSIASRQVDFNRIAREEVERIVRKAVKRERNRCADIAYEIVRSWAETGLTVPADIPIAIRAQKDV